MGAITSERKFAEAIEFTEEKIYYPAVRPGYVGWVNTFQYGNGDLGIAFNEIRREKNPRLKPAPLESVEAMAMPYRFLPVLYPSANPNLVSEYVYLRSCDLGKSWDVIGRCPAPARHSYHAGFPDGRLVRLYARGVWFELISEDWAIQVEESFDHGTTWKPIARLIEGYSWFPHRLKKLRDNTLIACGAISPTFGKNGYLPQRSSTLPGQRETYMSAFFASKDAGHTWTGPHYVLPGTGGHEFDFVELATGELFFFLSSIQSNRPTRQIVHRLKEGFVNDPLMEVHRGTNSDDNPQGGITPESIAITADGLLVGARRGISYVVSRDLGENWFEVDHIPPAKYQPMMELLPDGRFLTAWHEGGDTGFGEIDMYIGTHSFRVKDYLPAPTRLSLERELSSDNSHYVNAFRAVLTVNDKPVPGREIVLRVKNVWRDQPDGRENPVKLEESPDIRKSVTDENGVARFVLSDKDAVNDIHHGYHLVAQFVPGPQDTLSGGSSPTRMAYTMTPWRNNVSPYPVYNVHGLIMLTPETAKQFPELAKVVDHFKIPDPDVPFEKWVQLVGNEGRAREIVDFLITNHILNRDAKGVCRWYRAVHSGGPGEPYIHGVQICEVQEFCI